MPKVVRTDGKGLHQVTGKGAVGVRYVKVADLVASSAATEYTTAGDVGIIQPANSALVGVTIIVTTALAADSGNFGLRIGDAAGEQDIMALDADSLDASVTSIAVGVGTSTDSALTTALGGTATLVTVATKPYTASERTLFPEVVASGGSITAGVVKVFLEFLQF